MKCLPIRANRTNLYRPCLRSRISEYSEHEQQRRSRFAAGKEMKMARSLDVILVVDVVDKSTGEFSIGAQGG